MSVQVELQKIKDKTICDRIKILFKPFVNYTNDDKAGEFSITVVPEALRTIFYVEFWTFCFIGIIVTEAFSTEFNTKENPILDTFGNNNICVYFDDPPFSYFGAALFVPIILTAVLYLFVDLNRVYFASRSSKFPKVTECFYKCYKATSIFIAISLCFFVQVFATQPTQDINVHWIPFGIFQWALWLMGFQHYMYFLKIDVIAKNTKNYWCGIIYLIAMGIVVVVKFVLDLSNLALKDAGKLALFEPTDENGWVADLSTINDAGFMFLITLCPVFIYLIFVDDLDHVKFTVKSVVSIDERNEQYDQQEQELGKVDTK